MRNLTSKSPFLARTYSQGITILAGLLIFLTIAIFYHFPSPAAGQPVNPNADSPHLQNQIVIASEETPGIPIFFPIVRASIVPLPKPLPPPLPFSALPPIDFATEKQALEAQGLSLSYNKIGFHAGDRGRWADLVDMMVALDAAGVPFFLKSTDNAQPIYIAQELMKASGVPHILVYRRVTGVDNVPNYNANPKAAAEYHWAQHKAIFPPELDPDFVWVETVNEVDKARAEWLADFSYETALLTMTDGFRWAAFGWSSGEPEPEQWESPAMLRFLQLAGENPDRLAIALHEYSYVTDNISRIYPYLVGRFQFLFDAADRNGIPRPTVLITEWGWTYDQLPDPQDALDDIRWASWLYAAYPQVKGAAIWYLGNWPGDIEDQTAALIPLVEEYSLSHYFAVDPGFGQIDMELFRPVPPTR
jgi:hypothetical protein